jgi:hypothetical protein
LLAPDTRLTHGAFGFCPTNKVAKTDDPKEINSVDVIFTYYDMAKSSIRGYSVCTMHPRPPARMAAATAEARVD